MDALPLIDFNGNGRIDPSDIAIALAMAEAEAEQEDVPDVQRPDF